MHTLRRSRGCTLLVSLLLAACGSPDATGPGPDGSSAEVRVSANVSNTTISTIVVTISAADLSVSPVYNLTVTSGVASGTLRMPPGSARTFTVTAFDALGVVTHDGEAVRDVARGQNPPLAIALTPRSGQVPVTIAFGDFSVEVSPPALDIDVSMMLLQLTATVTDAGGQVITNPAVEWATTNPALAQVSATGLVTLLLPGQVDIVATYNGIAGISHLTLTGASMVAWFEDVDGDGYGDPASGIMLPSSDPQPAGTVAAGGDCDDTDVSVNPSAAEIYFDGIDNDCNGGDEGLGWLDADADGFGDPSRAGVYLLPLPDPLIPAIGPSDCDDANAARNPAATEVAGDGIDSDCDGFD